MRPIATLNDLPPDAFADALRPLFEAATPLAERLYAARPFQSYATLIDSAEACARAMPFAEQVVVLSAHPRIGADPATVSATSYREQGYSAETAMQPGALDSVYTRLAELNAAYEERFGFRFVVFVNGRSKAAILDVLRGRLQNSRETELQAGLQAMFDIARARLAAA